MAKSPSQSKASGDTDALDDDAPDVAFVEMTKGGETSRVHPDCVAAHRKVGWRTV